MASKKQKAGKTNNTKGSLTKVVALKDVGKWVRPDKGEKFFIGVESTFPEILFQIECADPGPYVWEWRIQWAAKVCGLREKLPRGSLLKTFAASGKTITEGPQWKVDLNGEILGGILTVQVVVAGERCERSVYVCGKNPEKEKMISYLTSFKDIDGFEKIIEQETRGKHFLDIDGEPITSFDKGYGVVQLTNPAPNYRQVWSWKENIKAGAALFATCRQNARKTLEAHPPYTDDMLAKESFSRWNGGRYYDWDVKGSKWVRRENVLCDSSTGNIGWNRGG